MKVLLFEGCMLSTIIVTGVAMHACIPYLFNCFLQDNHRDGPIDVNSEEYQQALMNKVNKPRTSLSVE